MGSHAHHWQDSQQKIIKKIVHFWLELGVNRWALVMNAGCYGAGIAVCFQGKNYDHEGGIYTKDKQSFEIGYRCVKKKEDEIFIGAWFDFPSKENNDENEEKKIDDLLKLRRRCQPLNWPTAGSTFRNPEHNFAAKLIEEVGLKGFQIGDARISNKHANFIENIGDATATDIEQLIYLAQEKVEQLKIHLQLEVKIIGESVIKKIALLSGGDSEEEIFRLVWISCIPALKI